MPKLPMPFDMSDQTASPSPGHAYVDGPTADLWGRYREIQLVGNKTNSLIEELLCRYDALNEQFRKEIEDHDREREYNRIAQRSLKDMETTILNMRGNMVRNGDLSPPTQQAEIFQDRDAFVLVLIDGDGLIVSLHPVYNVFRFPNQDPPSSTTNFCLKEETVASALLARWKKAYTTMYAPSSRECLPT